MQTPSLNHNPLDSGLPIVRLLSLVLGLSLPMSGFAADAVTVNGERNFNLGPQTTFTLDGETISAAQAAQMGAGYSVQVAIDNANATATWQFIQVATFGQFYPFVFWNGYSIPAASAGYIQAGIFKNISVSIGV